MPQTPTSPGRAQQDVATTTQPSSSSSSKPVIVLIHGAWHIPEVWDKVKDRLEAAGYEVYAPQLLTVVGPEPVNHTWRVDVAVIHDLVTPLFNQGRQVVVVAHSYGGLVATASVEGQSVHDRRARGLRGGFGAVVYVCAFAFPQRGFSIRKAVGGKWPEWMIAAEPFENKPFSVAVKLELAPFYTGIAVEETAEWRRKLRYQSQGSFEEPVTFCANDIKIPMTYLLCERDEAISIQSQESMAKAVPAMRTRRCTAGHSPFISQPDITAEVIIEAARNAS